METRTRTGENATELHKAYDGSYTAGCLHVAANTTACGGELKRHSSSLSRNVFSFESRGAKAGHEQKRSAWNVVLAFPANCCTLWKRHAHWQQAQSGQADTGGEASADASGALCNCTWLCYFCCTKRASSGSSGSFSSSASFLA